MAEPHPTCDLTAARVSSANCRRSPAQPRRSQLISSRRRLHANEVIRSKPVRRGPISSSPKDLGPAWQRFKALVAEIPVEGPDASFPAYQLPDQFALSGDVGRRFHDANATAAQRVCVPHKLSISGLRATRERRRTSGPGSPDRDPARRRQSDPHGENEAGGIAVEPHPFTFGPPT